MSAHVQAHYGESISPAQLGVILDLCDQQDDGMNGEKEECLVCGEELSFLALQGHLAMHMEDVALFILPNTQEDQDLGGTNDSVQAEKLSHSRSLTSSLGFSAPGDYGQNPADFSKLLTSEEAGFSSRFTHWKVTGDPEGASLKALIQQLDNPDEKVKDAAVETLGSQPALPYEIIEAMGTRLECRDRNGRTVLSWAAENGHEVTFERLIEKGADFESKDNYSRTVLHWASLGGKEAVVRMLLEIGADFNSRNDDGESPLYWAAHYGNEAVVRMLLEIGADFNSRNDDGESPLHCAARDGNEAIVRMLLELGADFESKTEDRESPLHYAAESGSEAAVRMLLEVGADDQMRDNAGHTPLSLATERGHGVIIQLLQQHADSPASRQSSEAPTATRSRRRSSPRT
jgi:ankyrin repeat protein